jgi:hypothetical protein
VKNRKIQKMEEEIKKKKQDGELEGKTCTG